MGGVNPEFCDEAQVLKPEITYCKHTVYMKN